MSHPKADRKLLRTSAAWALLAGLAVGTPALAQDQPAPEADNEEIIVTGSRIPRPDYAFSNPVTSVTGEAIQYSGITNVTDFLQDIPALVGSFDTASMSGDSGFIGATGLNLLNLRNLGSQRTLVLVNGRRHVAAVPASADIDTNTIPTDLIDRVDVLTGGASAIYGADGVSGVVNFIMKDDFEGLRVRGQYGEPEEGGAERAFLSATAGLNFAEDRGNVAVSFEVGYDGRLTSNDRAHTRRGARIVRNPNDFINDGDPTTNDDDPNLFDRVPLDDLRWFQSGTGGAVDVEADFNADFDGNTDAPWDNGVFGAGGIQSFTFQQGGSGTPVAGYGVDLLGETYRYAFNLFGHYDLSDRARFFTEQKIVLTEAYSYGQPNFDLFLLVQPDNPFMPPNIAAAVADAGSPFMFVTRDNFDLGVRAEDISRETYRGVWGLEGEATDWLKYNVSYVYGRVDSVNVAVNNRFNDRFSAAVDAVDADPGPGVSPVCRSTLDPTAPQFDLNVTLRDDIFGSPTANFPLPGSFTPGPNSGCVPINIFGDGSPSPEAIAWIMTDSTRDDEITQQVGTAYVVGSIPGVDLPGGKIKFVLGGEWRRETSESIPSLEDQLGLTFNNQILPSRGAYEVREAFAEFEAPILAHAPLFDELALNGAVRLSDYSSFGETTTWNYGLVWSPIPDITFRGTQAEAVRVPNIGELFDPLSQNFAFIFDPCDIASVNNGTEFREANCAALLTALGADSATFEDPNVGVTVAGFQSGNRELDAETAETTTLGVILRPRFIEGFTVSIDYYDINLTNAINVLDPQDIADQCVDLPTLDNQFCGLITRVNGGPNAGGVVSFITQPRNVAQFSTTGIDFSIRYLFDPSQFGVDSDVGTFTFSLVGNHLGKLEFVNLPGAAADPSQGELGAPEWQINFDLTWRKGPLLLNYGYNYYSETFRFDNVLREAQPDDLIDPSLAKYDARSTHDLQARWDLNEGFTIYGGVNNMLDQKPDDFAESYPVSAIGRFFYVGFTTKVDSLTRPR